MNQCKISETIKKIRQDNNMTQKEFADSLGVTFQAVSKWENGKNLPDISILKDICSKYEIDINELLGNKLNPKKSVRIHIILLSIIILLIIGMIVYKYNHDDSIELTEITTTCNIFKLTGNAAFSSKKTSINISNIEFCGEEDNTKYKTFKCELIESYDGTDKLVTECTGGGNMTLQEYLTDKNISISNYTPACSKPNMVSLYLKIVASNNDSKETVYEIPLEITKTCDN